MSASPATDVHAPYVQQLTAAGDWAALVRYWMAHQEYTPALDAAIAAVGRRAAQQNEPWQSLATFLAEVQEDPLDPSREPPRELVEGLAAEGEAVLVLLLLYPRMALCEMAGRAPVEQQDWLYHIGLDAAKQAADVGRRLQD